MINFLIGACFIYLLALLSKPFRLSEDEYRKFFLKRWKKDILGGNFEKRMRRLKTQQKIMFWIFLFLFFVFIGLSILFS